MTERDPILFIFVSPAKAAVPPVQGIQKERLPTNDVYIIMGSVVNCIDEKE
jgi:hypothetical protein